jgi:dolichol-phosphate mannosyltransferase
MRQKLSIIIPCYNEGDGINYLKEELDKVLPELKKAYDIELLFVDDGSTDNTYELLEEYFGSEKKNKIIKHTKNMNLGAAMRTGFSAATGDIMVTMDSDCTYRPNEIVNMLKLLENADIVTASPYHPKGNVKGVPKYRLFLSWTISLIYRILTMKKIYTFTALFRAYKRETIGNIKFKSNDFMATAEFLIKAIYKGYKVREYPTTLYVRKYGQSKMRLLKVILSHVRLISRIITFRL